MASGKKREEKTMNGMELIRHRRSVRTFDGSALRPEDGEKIMAYAKDLENPYGVPIAWRLLSAKADGLTSPVIVGADTFIAGKVRRVPHAEEAFGYAFERIVLFAESMGVGTTWIAGTMDRAAFERAMELDGDEVMPCVSPLGYPANKMSLRETMMRRGVKADSRLDFSELFFDRGFDTPLRPDLENEVTDALEMVRWAPSAVNKQPWRVVIDGHTAHFYEKKNKGYVDSRGWDLQKVDIGIALCHFAYGLEENKKTAKLVLADPGIPAPGDTAYIASCEFE